MKTYSIQTDTTVSMPCVLLTVPLGLMSITVHVTSLTNLFNSFNHFVPKPKHINTKCEVYLKRKYRVSKNEK
jgi:hypothetical protein